jgi:hypothetical protein
MRATWKLMTLEVLKELLGFDEIIYYAVKGGDEVRVIHQVDDGWERKYLNGPERVLALEAAAPDKSNWRFVLFNKPGEFLFYVGWRDAKYQVDREIFFKMPEEEEEFHAQLLTLLSVHNQFHNAGRWTPKAKIGSPGQARVRRPSYALSLRGPGRQEHNESDGGRISQVGKPHSHDRSRSSRF